MERRYMDDEERSEFLKRLDEAVGRVEVTDWEAQFIESNLGRSMFSAKQREAIDRMHEKYGEKVP